MEQALATWVPSTVLVGVIVLFGTLLYKAGLVIVAQALARADRLEASIAAVGIEVKALSEKIGRSVTVDDHRATVLEIWSKLNDVKEKVAVIDARSES